MSVVFVPVRHHSPACARLVESVIRALQPRHVLIEGPADFNDRIDELFLDHELPVAVYTGFQAEDGLHASWLPLCEYSPEWVALATGRECGARLRFIDLPVWHPALRRDTVVVASAPGPDAGEDPSLAPADSRYMRAQRILAQRFHTDDVDALWDHLFEIPDLATPAALAERLDTWFTGLRGDSLADAADTAREAYMSEWIRAAQADSGPDENIVVVTGGFHMPALRGILATTPSPEAAPSVASTAASPIEWPAIPEPPTDLDQPRSYLVPFSFRRLDSLSGYRSGMPSPAYYQQLFEAGPQAAAQDLMAQVAQRLRKRKQNVSTPDLTAARVMAESLARLRGNPVPARTDVLDGLASALLKSALDVPLPWTQRSSLAPATDPVVVEMVAALSGDQVGRLAPDTPLPPLWHDVEAQLHTLNLGPGTHSLSLTDPDELKRSRLLHRLRVLNIASVDRIDGPLTPLDPELTEVWTIGKHVMAGHSVIEASGFGPTVADASLTALSARVTDARTEGAPSGRSPSPGPGTGLARAAEVVFDAVLCGHSGLTDELLQLIFNDVRTSSDLSGLVAVLETASGLRIHGGYLGAAGGERLGRIAQECVPRILWLVEAVRSGDDADAAVSALASVRDIVLAEGRSRGPDAPEPHGVGQDEALAVAHRLATSALAPLRVRGAALGLSWALGEPPEDPARTIRGSGMPQELGDFLAGLFALARDEALTMPDVVETVDAVVCGFDAQSFLVALPSLREAFALFPPREREQVGRQAARIHGHDDPVQLDVRTEVSPLIRARAAAVQERARFLLVAAGLTTATEHEEARHGR